MNLNLTNRAIIRITCKFMTRTFEMESLLTHGPTWDADLADALAAAREIAALEYGDGHWSVSWVDETARFQTA